MKTQFAKKTTYRGDKCYMPRRPKYLSPKRYPCRCDHACAAEATKTPPTRPKYSADAFKDFADASKIFRRRVQGFRRRVHNISPTHPKISPTRPKYFAEASKDFTDASKIFRRRVQRFHRRCGNAADATSYQVNNHRLRRPGRCCCQRGTETQL